MCVLCVSWGGGQVVGDGNRGRIYLYTFLIFLIAQNDQEIGTVIHVNDWYKVSVLAL